MKSKIHELKSSSLVAVSKKFLITAIAIVAFAFTACNSANNSANQKQNSDTMASTPSTDKDVATQTTNDNAAIKKIVDGYLQIKNALTNDNGSDAAAGGKAMVAAMSQLNTSAFTEVQKKTYNDMQDDLKENAEHIGENADKIAHQREHFDMLSQDVYDLVKTFNAGEKLYKVYCPMYNKGKGAFWISETKEIKNPYLGKEMPTCGEIKEEIK
jgi:hypothetical protein